MIFATCTNITQQGLSISHSVTSPKIFFLWSRSMSNTCPEHHIYPVHILFCCSCTRILLKWMCRIIWSGWMPLLLSIWSYAPWTCYYMWMQSTYLAYDANSCSSRHLETNSFYFFLIFGSVSDLLDYINPSRDAKVRDVVAGKRKSYITKVPGYSCLIKTTLTHHTAYDTREKLHQFHESCTELKKNR